MVHPQNDRLSSEIYLSGDERPDVMGRDGLPEAHLVEHLYCGEVILRFCDDVTGKLMTAEARRLQAAGLWCGKLRGMDYRTAVAKAADLRPGRPLTVMREPNNPHDPYAVGIGDARGQVVGYVSRAKARRMATLLDSGEQLVAVSMQGTGPGRPCTAVTFVAARPEIIAHVTGPRPAGAAKPAHWV